MKREERLREELEEAWFALVVEKIAQQEGAELNALNEQLNNDPQYAVPEELDRRSMETIRMLVAQDKKKRKKKAAGKIFLRVACAAMIASMMLGSAYAVLPYSRKIAVKNLLIEVKDVSTRLVKEDIEKIDGNSPEVSETEPKVLLGYHLPTLPEDFVIEEEKQLSHLAWVRYTNSAGDILKFRFTHDVSNAVEVDTENAQVTPIIIHGYEGLLSAKNNRALLVWNDLETNTFIYIESVGVASEYLQSLAAEIIYLTESE